MSVRLIIVIVGASSLLAGCSSQSATTPRPIWVSKGINGLQRSVCNCGGIEEKKQFKKRREAESKAQRMRSYGDGRR